MGVYLFLDLSLGVCVCVQFIYTHTHTVEADTPGTPTFAMQHQPSNLAIDFWRDLFDL